MLMMAVAPVISAGAKSGISKSGLDLSNLDRSVKPTEDFYKFATGGWQKLHPLPAAYSRFGSFDMLQENVNKQVSSILTTLTKKKYAEGSTDRKLSDFYKLALDSARRNREGLAPVKPYMDEIEAAKSLQDIQALQLKYAKIGLGQPFGSYFAADDKNVKNNIFQLSQGGLTLGQKDWYVNNDEATRKIREAYKKHIVRMFKLYGFNEADAEKKAADVFRFETELALISKSNTELRDPQANYNKMSLKDFESNYPSIPLRKLANAEGINDAYIQEMNVGQPSFFNGLDKLASVMTADERKAIMEWDLINASANALSDNIREANFDFFGRTMSGRKEDYPLWKRATNAVNGAMGEALGKMYCEKYFPESSKRMMEALIKNLQKSLGERIEAQTWMSDSTKKNALIKLSKFYVKVGYPNKWTDYSKLTIDPKKSYFENLLATRVFANDKMIADKAGKPVDKDEWFMTPQTVNAYYNPTTNEICFPAGILQRPFFDPKADAAFNYGAIGVVIGHEMTHGFDDQGRQYDADGNLHDWWTAQDAKNFDKRAKLYADYFDSIEVLPGLHSNGKFTLGENLADHGGLMVAFNAFKDATKDHPLKTVDGFTPEQRFFIAYAGVWGQNITDQEIRNRVKRDPHALGEWRVNGALPHIQAFYDAFGVKKGDKMYLPENERLQLW
jgi:putative endopeptidase